MRDVVQTLSRKAVNPSRVLVMEGDLRADPDSAVLVSAR
jgi:hypothetical protein